MKNSKYLTREELNNKLDIFYRKFKYIFFLNFMSIKN